MTATNRRWGFRARLTALIAVVFVAAGIVLLSVQYLLVQRLFSTAISTMTSCVDHADTTGDGAGSEECRTIADLSALPEGTVVTSSEDGYSVLIEQSTILSQEVLSGLLLWSIVILVAFTAVAVALAIWLSRRSFVRIGQITATTQRITRDDLHQRLALAGPADEIKELADTIDTMLDRLEASFIQQERFITNASHELRTPLTTTRTALEIPLTQGQVPPGLEPAVRRALEANQRSENLIAALLELARTTGNPGCGSTTGQTVDLGSVLADSLTRHAEAIAHKHLTVTTSFGPAGVVGVDAQLLTLLIDNLVDNAVRHNVDDGTLHLSAGSTDGQTWFEVTNSGPSFSPDEAARLTEPFNRGTHTRTASTGGLGLGLALVHNITTTLGAHLRIAPGQGGTGLVVRIALPVPRS